MYFCVKSIHLFHVNFKNVLQELPGGAVDKKPAASAEHTGSILGPGRSVRAAEQLSPRVITANLHSRACAAQQEKPLQGRSRGTASKSSFKRATKSGLPLLKRESRMYNVKPASQNEQTHAHHKHGSPLQHHILFAILGSYLPLSGLWGPGLRTRGLGSTQPSPQRADHPVAMLRDTALQSMPGI